MTPQIRSMTGFGHASVALDGGRLFAELRSVNHRFLEVRVRAGRELGDYVGHIEQNTRARFFRGRLEVLLRYEGPNGTSLQLDRVRARAVLSALEELGRELGRQEQLPLWVLSTVPDLFVHSIQADPESVRGAISAVLGLAAEALDAMRTTEGLHLALDLRSRLLRVEVLAAEVATLIPEVSERYRQRLRERLGRMLDGLAARADHGRVEQEILLLAEHADVTEELTRLSSHCRQFQQLLLSSDSVGRKLDFLLQEMSREVNTLGAKSSDADIALRVVELKDSELERMREQVQNVE